MDYKSALENRAKIMVKCQDISARSLVYQLCKNDILFWFDNFVWFDKNNGFFGPDIPQEVPCVLFQFQRDFVVDLWASIIEGTKPISERKKPTNVFIEKSRQMGLSWLILAVFLYGFIFHGHKYLTISQKESDVDNGDIKSHFGKIRFMLGMLPLWMLPTGLSPNSGTAYNKHCLISCDGTASISGESANPNAGRGGTYNAVLLDEMAFMQYAKNINGAVASATPCRIFNSTPDGMGNEFYRMRKMAIDGAFSMHRLHWTLHPYYTPEWYAIQCKEKTPEEVARELDINYQCSVTGRVYQEWNESFHDVDYDDRLPIFVGIDNSHGGADPHAVVVAQTDGHYWNIIDYVEIWSSIDDVASLLGRQAKGQWSDEILEFYARYLTYKPATFVADPYDTHQTWNDNTIFSIYQKYGIFLNTDITKNKEEQIMQTRTNLYRIRMNKRCETLSDCLFNSKYPNRSDTSNATSERTKPVHDQWSHGRTAMEYLISYLLKYSNKADKAGKSDDIAYTHNKQFRTFVDETNVVFDNYYE